MKKKTTNDRSPLRPLIDEANDALASQRRYAATPAARNGNGHHSNDKPLDGEAQWLLRGKLPPRAFEPHPRERRRAHALAHSVPLDEHAQARVESIFGKVFDATYAALAAKFENEIAAGRVEEQRVNTDRARLEREIEVVERALEDLPGTADVEQVEPRLPALFSAKGLGFVVCLMLFLVSSGAALCQIANLYLPAMQSWLFAGIAASPWVLAAVATEVFLLLTLKTDSSKFTWALRGAVAVLVVGITVWLAGLFPLAAPVNLDATAGNGLLMPDRRWAVAGQLLCELAVSFLLLTGLLKLLTYERMTVPNENRRRLADHVAELSGQLAKANAALSGVLAQLANAEGNMREWQNSRAAFAEEGVAVVNLRAADAKLLMELQRQREENGRVLSAFNQ